MAKPIDPAELAKLRKCERESCTFAVTNAIEDLKDILQCMSNHLLSLHPVGGSDGGGGGGSATSTAEFQSFRKIVMKCLECVASALREVASCLQNHR